MSDNDDADSSSSSSSEAGVDGGLAVLHGREFERLPMEDGADLDLVLSAALNNAPSESIREKAGGGALRAAFSPTHTCLPRCACLLGW